MLAPPPLNPAPPASTPTRKQGTIFRVFKSPEAKLDWIASSLTTAKAITAGAECIPSPYVKGVFGTVVVILETVETLKKNYRDDVKELCDNMIEIIRMVQDQLVSHGDAAAAKFKRLCETLEGILQGVLAALKQLQREPRGLGSCFKEAMKLGSTTKEISGYRTRIQELRLNFQVLSNVVPASTIGIRAALWINNCPAPSRIFHGRQVVLEQMHQFFKVDLDKQKIYLLHRLGGSGKAQIALKFIQESSSQFSHIFLVDTSTSETIETGLKAIAASQSAGSTTQDTLQWLKSSPVEWLLLFDNADNPKINLNQWFPQCTHGNIVITSRKPGLVVYAGSHSLVSDMEETDAVELLLKSDAQESSVNNKRLATDIVKALLYLPRAIIQAGYNMANQL